MYFKPGHQLGGVFSESYIELIRVAPVKIWPRRAPNSNPFDAEKEEPLGYFSVQFAIEDYISPEEYSHRRIKNIETHKQLNILYDSMNDIGHKYDHFFPDTPDEKERVDSYEALQKSIYSLPEFYFHDIALSWFMPATFRHGSASGIEDEYRRVLDKEARKECYEVTRKVLSLLTRYEPIDAQPYDNGGDNE